MKAGEGESEPVEVEVPRGLPMPTDEAWRALRRIITKRAAR
jgi:hypothetical protein